MARVELKVFPSADIHLIKGTDYPAVEIDFVANVFKPDGTFDSSIQLGNDPHFIAISSPPNILSVQSVSKHLKIVPQDIGQAFVTLQYTAADGDVFTIMLRVQVHASISEIWFGNKSITMFGDQSNYIPSVFAKFDDGIIGDITGHPYYTLNPSDPTVITVENQSPNVTDTNVGNLGRITALATTVLKTAQLELRESLAGGGFISRGSIPINVQPALTTSRPEVIVKCETAPSPTDADIAKRFNIVLIGEGFDSSDGDKRRFRKAVARFKSKFFSASVNPPFDLLKDSFYVWSVFDSSTESGVSIGTPVAIQFDSNNNAKKSGALIPAADRWNVSSGTGPYTVQDLIILVGLPKPDSGAKSMAQAKTDWGATPNFVASRLTGPVYKSWLSQGFLLHKDSRFGLIHGSRLGEPKSKKSPDATTSATWAQPDWDPRAYILDVRRRGDNNDDQGEVYFETYLNSLDWNGSKLGPKLTNKFVAFLVNDRVVGGSQFLPRIVATSAQKETEVVLKFQGGKTDGSHLEHSPQPDHDFDLIDVVNTMSHEWGHALALGEEYGGSRHFSLSEKQGLFDSDSNITYEELAGVGADGKVTKVDGVPWWGWFRIRQAAPLADVLKDLGGNLYSATLKPGKVPDWLPKGADGAQVYLQNPNRRLKKGNSQDLVITGLTITAHSEANNTLTLSSGQALDVKQFPAGSFIYFPLIDPDANRDLFLIEPEVVADLLSNPIYRRKTGTACQDLTGTEKSQTPERKFKTFKVGSRARIIGVYDGAEKSNCGIYRPAGMCRMRNVDDLGSHFCFVCQYLIVSAIDPEQHGELDKKYPGRKIKPSGG